MARYALFIVILMTVSLPITTGTAAAMLKNTTNNKITIIYGNDVRGELEPCG